MGIPILRPDPDPLPPHKGYFCPHVTANEVGSYAGEVLVRQQEAAAAAFVPLVSVDAGTLQPAWAGQRLHWLCGAPNEDGAFFRVHSTGQLEYLGTTRHPSPDWLGFAEEGAAAAAERPVSPGYVEYSAQEAEEGSDDDEGYHDAPAVFLGGEPPTLPAGQRPTCLRCSGPMHFVGLVELDVFSDELDDEGACVLLFYCDECRRRMGLREFITSSRLMWLGVAYAFSDCIASVRVLDPLECRADGSGGTTSGGGGSDGMITVLVDKFSLRLFRYHRGELIVLKSPEEPRRWLARRLVGLEGDFVSVAGSRTERVPKGCCWVEADGGLQAVGVDSRVAWGSVPLALIEGRVHRVLWPPARWGELQPQPSPSGTRVVGKNGSLEFLHPPGEHEDWWS
ncbi:inner membrane protease subunit 2 [Micractinium conductrix]|uniref:Inner membrane protease subunit 2 n=1 Tax=Micractinium conductrix TaxID=554055 RepID=A0A2P6V6R6_9CHLO|nr:inner membrane protease subunit 2 [Micractinium conductrix]|eukprot:PSC69783.1 inner membrane protease subunit 2 [Micractinium conductrix]